MALNYLLILTNSLFAGTVSVIITQAIFFAIARVFNYDFVFPVETGRNLLHISEDFYSNSYAGIRGLLVHLGIGLLIMLSYSFVFVHAIGIFFDIGPYTYATPKGTAVFENVFWLVILGLLIYVVYIWRDNNLDRFSVFLFLYLMTMIVIMGVLFGLYLLGNPGMLTFRIG